MDSVELHHLHCLVALAEELNFGRAASRLHMSQPPLTRIVAEVEHTVGAKLFERTTRRVSLTPVGEVFVAEARAVLARAEAAREAVRAAARRQAGQLRLAYTPLALQTVLPQIISRLRERDHEVSIDLVELAGDAQREALLRGQVDMGFAPEAIAADGFASRLLYQEPLQVLLLESHPLAGRDSLRLADLAGETFLLHARHEYPHYYDRVLRACREAGFTPRIYHREARQNCMALVAAGQGVLLTPASYRQTSAAGLRHIPLEPDALSASLHSEVWAVLPAAPGSPRVEALREIVLAGSNG